MEPVSISSKAVAPTKLCLTGTPDKENIGARATAGGGGVRAKPALAR
jgi:hypothetical protein